MTDPLRRSALLPLAAALCALALFAAPAAAQTPPPPALVVNQLDVSSYPAARAVVTVIGADGLPVRGLAAAQFAADDGGAAVAVAAVEPAQDSSLGLSVVLAIDVSGSMQGVPIANARDAAAQFVRGLGPNDQAAVVSFAETVTTVVPLTSDRQRLEAGIASLQANGATALYEAVQSSAGVAGFAEAARRAIIVLSDGQNETTSSDATAQGSIDAARSARAPVFTIGFGPTPDESYLRSLAEATQGQYTPATSLTVSSVYDGLATLLRSQYVITLRDPVAADGAAGTLRITAQTASGQASGSAAFTRGVAPPVPAATAVPVQPEPAPAGGSSGGAEVVAIVVVAVVGAVVLALLALVARGYIQRRRTRRSQEAITEVNPTLARAQGLPAPLPGEPRPNGAGHTGRLLALDSPRAAAHTFGDRPITLGYDGSCDVRLERAGDVAPRHAQVWMREGKMMLRHLGGARRPTIVAGRPVDWVILEDGDEIRLGPHRYRAERVS